MRLLLALLPLFILAVPTDMPAQAAAGPIGRYAGTWEAKTFSRNRDTVMASWRWVQNQDSTGTIRFGDETAFSPTRVLFATTDSLVFLMVNPLRFEVGNPLDGARQRYVVTIRDDSILGTVYTRIQDGREGRRPFSGARVTANRSPASSTPRIRSSLSDASRLSQRNERKRSVGYSRRRLT